MRRLLVEHKGAEALVLFLVEKPRCIMGLRVPHVRVFHRQCAARCRKGFSAVQLGPSGAAILPARLWPRVAFAAVAVKRLRFAPMNAPNNGAPLTAVLAAAVFNGEKNVFFSCST